MNQEQLRELIDESEENQEIYEEFIKDSDPLEKKVKQSWYKCTYEILGKKFTKIRHERINSDVEIIFEVEGSYFSESASYSSYDGTNYDCIGSPIEVMKKEKTITVYE